VKPRTLRLLSWNILAGGGSRCGAILKVLSHYDADVVALQEASTTWGRGNIAERLAKHLGFHHVYAPATTHVFYWQPLGYLITGAINFGEGEAVLSRYPIVASEVRTLPRCLRFLDPRIALRAEIDAPGGRLQVFSVHTSSDPCQIKKVGELARETRNGRPAIVMGDFNMTERTDAIDALKRDVGFIDAFRIVNPDEPGATTWQNIFAPVSTARRRIDYVFVLPGRGTLGRVRDSKVVLDAPERFADGTMLWPSDHYGVLADIDVSGH
jgi:endonuclease/exonuclease/phosphatase family metal-dependent hydrolase